MYIDFKETIWYRLEIPLREKDKILRLAKEGKINDSSEAIMYLEEEGVEILGTHLLETAEQLPTEENDNQSTIKIWDNLNQIWTNEINKG